MLEWIKEHPYLTGGVILGAIVLWVIFRSQSQSAAAASAAGSTTVTGPSDALQEAELAAGVQLQQTQLGVQGQIAQTNAAVNAQQLNDAAGIAMGQISAGVQNTQTAAQLQLGLAQYGYSPSSSPFGLTVPVGGSAATTPATVPGSVNSPPVVVGYGSTQAEQANQAAAENAAIAAATVSGDQSITASQFSDITPATTGAGSGGTVNVPSVPVYLPSSNGPVQVGVTQPFTIPSSSGMTGQQYWQDVSQEFNTMSLNPSSVASLIAAQTAADEEYVTDPNSCHNVVCGGSGGGGVPAGSSNLAPPSLFGGSSASCAPGLTMVNGQCVPPAHSATTTAAA